MSYRIFRPGIFPLFTSLRKWIMETVNQNWGQLSKCKYHKYECCWKIIEDWSSVRMSALESASASVSALAFHRLMCMQIEFERWLAGRLSEIVYAQQMSHIFGYAAIMMHKMQWDNEKISGKRKKININASIIRRVGRPDDNTSISTFSLFLSLNFPSPEWH